MRKLLQLLCICCVVEGIAFSICSANEESLALDTFLRKWQAASANVKTFDAKLTILSYDHVFGNGQPEVSAGRFYFETPGRGYFRHSTAGNVFIWQENEVLELRYPVFQCSRWPKEKLLEARQSKTLFSWSLEKWIALRMPIRPQEFLPFVTASDPDEAQLRFAFTLKRKNGDFLVSALPKLAEDKSRHEKIEVLVSPKTYLTSAIQVHAPQGAAKTTYRLDNVKINVVPTDREKLIKPDLSQFEVFGG